MAGLGTRHIFTNTYLKRIVGCSTWFGQKATVLFNLLAGSLQSVLKISHVTSFLQSSLICMTLHGWFFETLCKAFVSFIATTDRFAFIELWSHTKFNWKLINRWFLFRLPSWKRKMLLPHYASSISLNRRVSSNLSTTRYVQSNPIIVNIHV